MENKIIIDGRAYPINGEKNVLQLARNNGIDIPSICYHPMLSIFGACRMCVVEVKGAKGLVTSCVYPVAEGMEIFTQTKRVIESRVKNLQLLLSNHNRECLSCVRSGNCELQALCRLYDIREDSIYDGERPKYPLDGSAVHLVRDNNKCILCRRCVAVCEKNQGVGVIGPNSSAIPWQISLYLL